MDGNLGSIPDGQQLLHRHRTVFACCVTDVNQDTFTFFTFSLRTWRFGAQADHRRLRLPGHRGACARQSDLRKNWNGFYPRTKGAGNYGVACSRMLVLCSKKKWESLIQIERGKTTWSGPHQFTIHVHGVDLVGVDLSEYMYVAMEWWHHALRHIPESLPDPMNRMQ